MLRYNRLLMEALLAGRLQIATIVNATVIPLDEAPGGYRDFDACAPRKYVLDPHGRLKGKRA